MENKYIEFAKRCMKEIMYDNGMVDRLNPEKYEDWFVNYIADQSKEFIDNIPEMTDEDYDLLCYGNMDEAEEKFSSIPGYRAMNDALNEYFDPTSTGTVEIPEDVLRERLTYNVHALVYGKIETIALSPDNLDQPNP